MADLRGEEVSEQCKPNEMLQLSTGLEKLTWLAFHNKVKLFFSFNNLPKGVWFQKTNFLANLVQNTDTLGCIDDFNYSILI